MKIVSERVTVLKKDTNVSKNKEGVDTTYFNITVGGMGFSNRVGVPEDVYNAVSEGDEIRLSGSAGFKRDGSRFWFFDDIYLGK